ncbi:hypothetical protein XU18_2854 [Perkinsela sp. CCAP 1560/4]|nr:hypothetical protein XU18_2854 [Perkinsela sp. CCAP 1560/4]|eukprot:KNH06349.1 hypothetical protein XU18_2854 [Perkinsela sp. CCAP 1560/4]
MPLTSSKFLGRTCFENVWIQKCDPLYTASVMTNIPLHLSMEAAVFKGWKNQSTHYDTMGSIHRPFDENRMDYPINTLQSSTLPDSSHKNFQTDSLSDLVQALKRLESPSKAEFENSQLARSTLRAVMESLLTSDEFNYIDNQTKGKGLLEKFSRYFRGTQKVMPMTDLSLREAYDYTNMCRVYYLKSTLRELTRLGFRCAPETHMMLRTILHKYSFFLLDAELLHEVVQFGTFDEPFGANSFPDVFVHEWRQSVVKFFMALSQMKNSPGLRGPSPFTFSLGNIVQYYTILHKYDAAHGLLSVLVERFHTAFVEKSVTFPERNTRRPDTNLDLIRKVGGLSIDGLPLTSKDLYTLLLSLQGLSFQATETTALCAYFLLLSDIHSVLKLRCLTERWDLSFVADCAALAARVRNSAQREFSRANAYLAKRTRAQSVQKTVLDVLTKADKARTSLLISSLNRLHENYKKFISVDLHTELIRLTSKLVDHADSTHGATSPHTEAQCLNPMALAKLFAFSVKQSHPSLALHIVDKLLSTHSAVLRRRVYSAPWIPHNVSYLFIILRSYAVLRQNTSIEANVYSSEFLGDLKLTWMSIIDERQNLEDLDFQILPYMAFLLHKYHSPSTTICSEFIQLIMGTHRVPAVEAIALIVWIFVFLKNGQPRCVEPVDTRVVRQLMADFSKQVMATPIDSISAFSKSVWREIAKEVEASWLGEYSTTKALVRSIKHVL